MSVPMDKIGPLQQLEGFSMSSLQNIRAATHHGVLLSGPSPRPTLITVRATARGQWHVTSNGDRFGGTFRTREAALYYARHEAVALPRAEVVVFEVTDAGAPSETYGRQTGVRVPAIRPTQSRAA